MSFKTSTGERLSKTTIDNRIRQAKATFKALKESEGINYCEGCGTNQDRIDCSHIVSVNDCQNDGMAEFAFDIRNLSFDCRSKCHPETERGTIEKHLNRDYKLEFIEFYNDLKKSK